MRPQLATCNMKPATKTPPPHNQKSFKNHPKTRHQKYQKLPFFPN